ncbi:MAG: hypothetical protein II126_05085, partial [Erysipelotrichaceae bacterium]|nr:hypothetical protein [Erysipelotrichaceae bacterium]
MNKAVEIIAAKGFDEKEALVILSALRRFPAAGTGFLKACLKMNYGIRKAVRELLEIWLENDLCMDEDIGEIMKMAAVGAKEVLS